MAGIGFELRRMIDQREGMIQRVRAYICAGLISSGPWIMTILTLSLLSLGGPWLGGSEGFAMFRALVTYAFAFSLVIQGIGQMAITRRVADLLYGHDYKQVLPAFAACMIGVGALQAAIGTAFCVWAGFSPALSMVAVALYVIVSMTWVALVWLSVTREYDEVLRAYIYGTLVSMVGLLLVAFTEGTTALLAAYTAGQACTLFLLVRIIAQGMDADGKRDFSVYRSLPAFPPLVGVGLFYNLAIWVDKMVFWFVDGYAPHPLVRYHPLYDTCSFLAYLTVVPALAVNLIRLETSFYEHYRAYYGSILGGMPLKLIDEKKERMIENLRESTVRLLRVQGALTTLVILFAPQILHLLEMPETSIRIFRLTCLGAFFHVMLLITILMQLYFDFRWQAFSSSLLFLLLNAGLAFWSVEMGVSTYGIGYAIASFLSLLLAYTLLNRGLERLDFATFTSQPIGAGEAPHSIEPDPKAEPKAAPAPAPAGAEAAPAVAAIAEEIVVEAPQVFVTEAGMEPEASQAAGQAGAAEADPAAFPPLVPLLPVAPIPATEPAMEVPGEPGPPAADEDATHTELGGGDLLAPAQPAARPMPGPREAPAPRDEGDATHTELANMDLLAPAKTPAGEAPAEPAGSPPKPPEPEPAARAPAGGDEDLTQTELGEFLLERATPEAAAAPPPPPPPEVPPDPPADEEDRTKTEVGLPASPREETQTKTSV